eukprot:12886285-Prorocentrum_lima.AAC.1
MEGDQELVAGATTQSMLLKNRLGCSPCSRYFGKPVVILMIKRCHSCRRFIFGPCASAWSEQAGCRGARAMACGGGE